MIVRNDDTAAGVVVAAHEISAEAALDGLYMVRTSLAETRFDVEGDVRAYKTRCAEAKGLDIRGDGCCFPTWLMDAATA